LVIVVFSQLILVAALQTDTEFASISASSKAILVDMTHLSEVLDPRRWGTSLVMDFLYGCDRSDLYSDEGPPIGEVGSASPAFIKALRWWLLRWN
jgi:hypothetical protein